MIDKRLLDLLGENKKYIVWIVLLNLIGTVLNVLFAAGICWCIELVIQGNVDLVFFKMPFLSLLGIIVLRFIVTKITGNLTQILGFKSKETLRSRLYQKINTLGSRESGGLSIASLTQVSIEGIEQLDLYYSMYLPQFFYAMISPILLFILFIFINKFTAIVLICCVPLIPMSIVMVSKYAKKIFAKYWGQYTKMGDAFLDNITGMKELKIFNADGFVQEKTNTEAEDFRKITMKVLTMQLASTTIMDLVAYGGAAFGIVLANLTSDSMHFAGISTPTLVLFIVLVAVDFFLPLRALGSAFHVSMNGATAGKKILAILDLPEPIWGNEDMKEYSIHVNDVSFAYMKNQEILKHIHMDFKPHQVSAIVGESGSGKSTIVQLLRGLNQDFSGEICFGEQSIKSLSRESLNHHVAFVSYNSYLFNDTVRNNFLMASKNATDLEINKMLHEMKLDQFSLDDVIEENGSNISGGQKQRMVLGIQLLANKDIYILDEATSNIDVTSEEIIMNRIYTIAKDKTVIIISHRLENVALAEQIYVLNQGNVIEQGNHEKLLSQNGYYSELFKKQKALENAYKEKC